LTTADGIARGPSPAVSARDTYRLAHDRGRALAELCRLQIARVSCAILVATAIAAATGLGTVLSGVALVCASCAIAAVLNDRADVVSDRLNQRTDRPLATGVLGSADVSTVLFIAALVVVMTQFGLPQPGGLVVTTIGAFVAWASACDPFALQRRGLVGLAVLALGYFVLPIMLVLGPGRITILLPLVLFGSGVLAHKDVKDEFGDREAGKRTLLVRVGYSRMSHSAAGLGAAGVVGLWVTVGPGWWFGPATVTVVMLVLMARRGHTLRPWLAAKAACALTAVLVGIGLGSVA
jgi:4-hydroxybenzoate polyprenyltransferase